MTTPTLSMQIYGETSRERAVKKARSEAAKKAWRTRRRRAKPTKIMRRWLEWLAQRSTNGIVQRWERGFGSMFSFGGVVFGEMPSLYPPPFTRGTFFALQGRGWVSTVHQTEERVVGHTMDTSTGEMVERWGWTRYWQITDKGRKVLGG